MIPFSIFAGPSSPLPRLPLTSGEGIEAASTNVALRKASNKATFADSLETFSKHMDDQVERRGSEDLLTNFDVVVQDYLGRDRFDDAYRYLERVRAVMDAVMIRVRPRAIEQGVKPRPEFDPTLAASAEGATIRRPSFSGPGTTARKRCASAAMEPSQVVHPFS